MFGLQRFNSDVSVIQHYLYSSMSEEIEVSGYFSVNKTLHDYQIQAIINAYKVLILYYRNSSGNKFTFYETVYKNNTDEYIDFKIRGRKIKKYLPIQNNKYISLNL